MRDVSSRNIGPYQVIARLGSSPDTNVFLAARDDPTHGETELSVVKRLRKDLAATDAWERDGTWVRSRAARYLEDARRTMRLEHPNIVKTFIVDLVGRSLYRVEEFIDGQPLDQVLFAAERGGGLAAPWIVYIVDQVLAALDYAHNLTDVTGALRACAHGDIQASNIFVTYEGDIKLIDFSSDAVLQDHGIAEAKLRERASLPPGAVPFRSGARLDPADDLIAVGRLLRQCIPLGAVPEANAGAGPDVMAVRRSSLRLDLASALLPVAERAVEPDPQNRYASARAMRVDLERLGALTNARESLARFVQHAFEVPHRERRAHIQELLAERAILQSNVTAPQLMANQELGVGGATPLESRRPSTPVPTPTPSSLHYSAPVQTRKRQTLVLFSLGALGLLGGLLWFLGRGSDVIAPAQAAVSSWANRTTLGNTNTAEALASHQQPATPSVTLRLCGSNTLGSELIPELSRAFLDKKTGKTPTQRPSLEPQESAFVSNIEGTDVGIEIHAHGSATAFEGLKAEQCDIGMASRAVEDAEAEALLAKGLGDIRKAGSEHVIALDGIAVLVHPGNPLRSLDRETLKQIYTGAIHDWSELGGNPGPITVLARDNKSGTYDTFKHLVLGSDPLVSSAQRYEDSAALADSVASDPSAIGFVGFAHIRSAKALAIGESGVAPMLPTRFTVSTEGYILARRLFLYTLPKPRQAWSPEFVSFVLSRRGQEIVATHHFVDLTIGALDVPCESHCKDRYGLTVARAKRLSLDFRFRTGSNDPDSRAELDLDRLVAFLGEQHPNGKVLLLGFSDSGGRTSTNEHLSLLRAQAIAHELTTRGVHPETVVGFGAKNPVAANTTEEGRRRNRRVEVWIRE